MKVTFTDEQRAALDFLTPESIVEEVVEANAESPARSHRVWATTEGEVEVAPQDALQTKRLLLDPMLRLTLMFQEDSEGIAQALDEVGEIMDRTLLDALQQNDGDTERTVLEATPQSILDLFTGEGDVPSREDYVRDAGANLLELQQHYAEKDGEGQEEQARVAA